MTDKLSSTNRFLRFLIGVALFGWFVAGGSWWGIAGFFLIATASWGLCPVQNFIKN